jgi:hypothetical protein
MATVKLPRVLHPASRGGLSHEVEGSSLGAALDHLFAMEPALRPHLLDEKGEIRSHVLIFVDGRRAVLRDEVGDHSEIRVLQAASGG